MTGHAKKRRPTTLVLTARGALQLALGAALLVAGALGGWLAPGAAGAALLLAGATGLAEVLLARLERRAGPLGRLLARPLAQEESWVRVDQHGTVIEALGRPGSGRGLYRQRSTRLTWSDAFGFWRLTRVKPASRELRVLPAVSDELAREVLTSPVARLLDPTSEQDRAGVRPYEKGDSIRQISWRQTAHHGELMSFEGSGRESSGVLLVADTLGAGSADGLASAVAALLQGLRRAPDVLLTDGELALRTPVQQERFCAAVVGEAAGERVAAERAREVARLAGSGSGRRRVVLVTCEPEGPLARELRRGPLASSLVVVVARGEGTPGEDREGAAEKDLGPRGAAATGRAPRPGAVAEIAALPCCCALAVAALASLNSIFYEGAWQVPVAALLVGGAVAGSGTGALMRWRGVRAPARAAACALLAAGVVAVGLALACALLEGRHNPLVPSGADAMGPLDALGVIVRTGADQLAGGERTPATQTWDLLVLCLGALLAALACALAGARSLRGAVALVPLALSVADQAVMGSAAHLAWVGPSVALGLLLVWLGGGERVRPVRTLLVCALAAALGWAGLALAPARSLGAWTTDSTRVETLVDLSRSLRERSDAQALTYTTTHDGPVYLRIGILNSFEGDAWRFEGSSTEAVDLEGMSALFRTGLTGDGTTLAPYITTVVRTEDGSVAAPPGSAEIVAADDGSVEASGCYVEPARTTEQAGELSALVGELATGVFGPGETERQTLDTVPAQIRAVADEARADGADASAGADDLTVVNWLVSYFTDGSFTYSLDAPGGDGQDNLVAIESFLVRRSGYCTHYATSFALLARELGVSSRVAFGYAPSSATEGGAYVVTMRQLHAWAEVWVEGIGWVGVDVTPDDTQATDVATDDASASEDTQEETPAEDAVADEGAEDAQEEVEEPGDDAQEAPVDDEGASAEGTPWQVVVLLALGVAGVAVAAALLRNRRSQTVWQRRWRRACRRARRSGVRWERSATEGQICELVCKRLDAEQARKLREICRNACLERYGPKNE